MTSPKAHDTGVVESFARLHNQENPNIHRGPAFLPWHRVFLAFFEEALRKVDPEVSLPYWDSTIDFEMSNPSLSNLWEAGAFGNGIGEVVTPPFNDWSTGSGLLERNVGVSGRLISKENVAGILRFCRLSEISLNTSAEREDSWEHWHNGVHVFVGGDMASFLSPYDPVFYFHHAFIDYVWELFRARQASTCMVNPTTDYPPTAGSQAAEAPMAGYPDMTNIEGCASYWITNWYDYEEAPACPTCTGNSLTYCSKSKNVCVARRTSAVPEGAVDQPRSRQRMSSMLQSLEERMAEQETTFVPEPGRNAFLKDSPPADPRTRYTIASDLAKASIQGLTEEMDALQVQTTGVATAFASSQVSSSGFHHEHMSSPLTPFLAPPLPLHLATPQQSPQAPPLRPESMPPFQTAVQQDHLHTEFQPLWKRK